MSAFQTHDVIDHQARDLGQIVREFDFIKRQRKFAESAANMRILLLLTRRAVKKLKKILMDLLPKL